MIKAVIFDIDGVLVDTLKANLKFFQDLMRHAGYKPPTYEEYKGLYPKHLKDVVRILTKSDSEEEIMRVWNMGASRVVNFPNELITSPPGVLETVEELSKKYKLGIVTNRIRAGVYSIPQLAALEKYIQVSVAFEDVKKTKPDPEPLLLAARKLGIRSEECVYIGDALTDVQAGKAAGTKVVTYPKILEKADAFFSSFAQLPSVLDRLESLTT